MNRPRRVTLESSWDWLEFAAQLPAKIFPFSNVTGHLTIMSGRGILIGTSAFNSGGSGSNVDLYDGVDASGIAFDAQPFGSSAPFTREFPGQGLLLEIGLHMYTGAATLTGSAWIIPLWHAHITPPGE